MNEQLPEGQEKAIQSDLEDLATPELRQRCLSLREQVQQSQQMVQHIREELGQLTYSITHDLKAPLRAIDGFARAVIDDNKGLLDERSLDYLDRVCKASEQMAHLLQELSQWSKIQAQPLHVEAVDLTALARKTAERLLAQVNRPYRVEIEPGLQVKADAAQAQLLLDKLFENAMKFTSRTDHPEIRFTRSEEAGKVIFQLSDNGAGFDPQYQEKLFRPFQKLHHAAEFPGGAGMGLAMAQKVIQRHQGTIWAKASPGNGATFYFTFGTP